MASPFFTILVPAYNQAEFLPLALESLLAQSCGDFEAVVVDDGSTDATWEVLAHWAWRDARIRPLRQANGGCAAALNTALRNARGTWIGWLSSDDLFAPDKLALHAKAIRDYPETLFFHTHFRYLDHDTGTLSDPDTWREIPPAEFQVSRFLEGNYVHGNAVMLRKDTLDAAGFFDEALRCGQDFDMWLRLSLRHRSRFLDARTCITRWHSGQTTNAFPVAGLYDSCQSCIRALNTHPLEALFPLLDLTRPEQAALAFGETLRIASDTGAYVYQLGYHTLLADRLREWLGRAPAAAAQTARTMLGEQLATPRFTELPAAIRQGLEAAAEQRGPWRYAPCPPLRVLEDTLTAPATPEQKRQNLRRYREARWPMRLSIP